MILAVKPDGSYRWQCDDCGAGRNEHRIAGKAAGRRGEVSAPGRGQVPIVRAAALVEVPIAVSVRAGRE